MRYTQITDEQVGHALDTIGVKSIEALFEPIPASIRMKKNLDIPEGLSEMEMLHDAESLARRNHDTTELTCFLGGGAYDHFIPTLVDALAYQSEFLTAYTPYQAEASQGILQLFYEFQTMVCELTGMEVANASMYEVASSTAEAVFMASAVNKGQRILVADHVHPDILTTLQTYTHVRDLEIITVPSTGGVLDEKALSKLMDDNTAALVVQSPNFLGCLERLDRIIPVAQAKNALVIVATDPIACGLLKSPGALGADIVVAEGQPLGIPMQYGAPYLGLMATREKLLRKLPGRVVGETIDTQGRRGFCLTLQTREQHIKRERATSNICTNQGLMAIRASVYLAAMGKNGLKETAEQCFDKAHYAASQIDQLDHYQLRFDAPFFKEFVVQTKHEVSKVLSKCREQGILGGVSLGIFDSRFKDCFLVAVTEKRTREEIDQLVEALRSV